VLTDAPTGYDPTVAFIGSVLFCAVPLYYLAYWLVRKLRWKSQDPRTVLGGVLTAFGWFTLFMLWLGPTRGLFFAVAALFGWSAGVWKAGRRNEVIVRTYYGARRPRKTTATGAKTGVAEEKAE
jgi:hypothetical protein